MRVHRFVHRSEVLAWSMCAVIAKRKPFAVALLGTSGRADGFTAATATEAEAFAGERLAADDKLFGGVVRHGNRIVSRVLPG